MADSRLAIVQRSFSVIALSIIKRLLMLALFVVLLVFFVNFTLSNTMQVALDIAGFTLPAVSSAALVMVSFVLGGFLALLVSLWLVIRLHWTNKSLHRKLKRRDAELHKLRSSTIKGLTDA